jgi:glycosyltransferase involved in cell wall biosynthesis
MKYSFVVPIFNDGALARDFCREMERTFRAYLGQEDVARDLEVIFVDDGSHNDSPRLLREVCDEYPFAKMAALSRNFGQHIALSCGYRLARGEYVGMLNVDQEDPPDQLPIILDALKTGEYDIVGGLYPRRDVALVARLTSRLFLFLLDRLTGHKTPANSSTVRIMNRRFVDAYNSLTERSRYIPGLEMWLGFRHGRVPVRHQPRRVGTSSYNFERRLRMAIASVISFSDYPLRLTVKFGMLVVVIGVILVVAEIIDKLFFRALLPGYTSTLAAIVFLGGAQITVTGVASLYIGRILTEVQGRPLYVVRETYGGLSDSTAPATGDRPHGAPPG